MCGSTFLNSFFSKIYSVSRTPAIAVLVEHGKGLEHRLMSFFVK